MFIVVGLGRAKVQNILLSSAVLKSVLYTSEPVTGEHHSTSSVFESVLSEKDSIGFVSLNSNVYPAFVLVCFRRVSVVPLIKSNKSSDIIF